MDAQWSPLSLEEVTARFEGVDAPWWVAGGVAIDLYLGYETRHHDDLDIEMLRSDRLALLEVFDGWDLHAVSQGQLVPWRGEEIADEVFGVWGRPDVATPWAIEVILANGDVSTWRFRRDPSISMPMGELVRTSHTGVPFCTPEVQLLYKAKRNRPKDDADLARCLHRLSRDALRWLQTALERIDPGHAWIPVLDSAARRATRMRDTTR